MSELDDAIEQLKQLADDWSRRRRPVILNLVLLAIGLLIWLTDILIDLPGKIEEPIRAILVYSNEWLSKEPPPRILPPLELKLIADGATLLLTLALVSILAAIVYWARSTKASNAVTIALNAAKVENELRKSLLGDKETLQRNNQQLREQLDSKPEDFFTDFSANVTKIKNSGILSRTHHLLRDDTRFRIDQEGTLFTTTRSLIKAADTPISFLLGGASCSPHELKNFGDIKLDVQSHTADVKLVDLPAINQPNCKEFFLVVLTDLAGGLTGGKELDYSISWSWPAAMASLVRDGKDSVSMSLRSKDKIPHIEITIEIHEDFGPVRISNIGYGDGDLECESPSPLHGYRTFKWIIEECQPDPDQEIVLEICKIK